MLVFLTSCTDYGFSNKGDAADAGATTHSGEEGDTYAPLEDTEDTPPDDSGGTEPGTGGGTLPDDACYEPEDGYSSNPAARILVTDSSAAATVSFVSSSTAYQDDLYLDAPESRFIVHAWSDAPGTSVSIGPYAVDTELIFGTQVTNTGDHWQSGPASRNADGVVHVAVTYEGGCSWIIGFEDLWGGGDVDYNDVILRVQGMLRQEG